MNTNPIRTLITVCTATAMLMLDIAVINSALPNVAADLGGGLDGVQWVVDAYTLALAATVLTAGSLADRYGRRGTFVLGLIVFTVSSLACALAQSMPQLDAARAVQGIGASAMFATSLALLGSAYPDWASRSKALAAYGATIGGSFAIGPLAGGVLTDWFGWRAVFLVNLPIGVFCLVGAVKMLESRDPAARRPDWLGQVFGGGSLFLLILALVRGNMAGWTSTLVVGSFIGAGACLVAFLVAERTVREPMLPLELFRSRTFTGLQIAAFAISASLFAIFLYVTIYLQSILGLSPIQAGLVYMPATFLSFVMAASTGSLLKRVSAKTLLVGGLALVTLGMAVSLIVDEQSSWWIVLPGQIIGLIGTGLFNPVVSGLVLSEARPGQEALAVGINDAARQTGIAVGVALLGAFIPVSAAMGSNGAAEYVHGLHNAIWLGVAIAAVGAVASAVLIRPRSPGEQTADAQAEVAEPALA
jgi:EmrB/QacA subfamily drug resistance transporter